jgi:hypothetical protein
MRIVTLIHGWLAALTFAAGLHLALWLPKRRVPPRGVALGFLLCLLGLYALGWLAYPEFRMQIRIPLVQDPARQWLANIFDVKEFLSVGALFLGIAAALPALFRTPLPDEARAPLRVALWFVLAVIAFNAIVGLVLAGHQIL